MIARQRRFFDRGPVRARHIRFALSGSVLTLVLLVTSMVNGFTPSSSVAAPGVEVSESCPRAVRFDRKHFSNSTRINHEYFPLTPGTQYTYEGTAEGERHRVVFTVTDLTKVIDGVRTVVILDQDFSAGNPVEEELAFFAQDDRGNVWSLGEYPEEREDGKIKAPETWINGKEGAEGGIHMLARPKVGGPWYRQGFVPDIEFLDCGKVIDKGDATCMPLKCFTDILLIKEKSPLESLRDFELKYHAPGVGIVRVGGGPDKDAEKLFLTEHGRLSASELRSLREKALKMDRRGCSVNEVYCGLPPAK